MKLLFDVYSNTKKKQYGKAGDEVTKISSSPAIPNGQVYIVERSDGFRFPVHSDKLLRNERDIIEQIAVVAVPPEKKTRKTTVKAPQQQSLF